MREWASQEGTGLDETLHAPHYHVHARRRLARCRGRAEGVRQADLEETGQDFWSQAGEKQGGGPCKTLLAPVCGCGCLACGRRWPNGSEGLRATTVSASGHDSDVRP